MDEILGRHIAVSRELVSTHGVEKAKAISREYIRNASFDMKVRVMTWLAASAVLVAVSLYLASASSGPAVVIIQLITLVGAFLFIWFALFLVDVFLKSRRAIRDSAAFIENPEWFTFMYKSLFKIPWGIKVSND